MAYTPEPSRIPKARSIASILVVDDDEAVRTTVSQLLQKHDYQVSEAKDGEGALKLLKKQIFQVVLLDEYLPGKKGLEVMHEARRHGCTSVFIVITGQPNIDLAVNAFRNGAVDFLQKPLHTSQLIEVVERYYSVDQVITYVRKNSHLLNSEEDVARALHLSSRTVARHIAHVAHQTFEGFLYQCRIEEAKRYLETTDLNMSQISPKVGFSTPSLFTRVFRRLVHQSPTKYRLSCRAQRNTKT